MISPMLDTHRFTSLARIVHVLNDLVIFGILTHFTAMKTHFRFNHKITH